MRPTDDAGKGATRSVAGPCFEFVFAGAPRYTVTVRLAGVMRARPRRPHVRVELGRVIALCLAVSLPLALSSSSCATGEEDSFEPLDSDSGVDSSAGSGFGGSAAGATGGGAGFGGFSGVGGTDPGGNGGVNPGGTGPGGVGGTGPGGTGGTDPGGTGGAGGTDPGGSGGQSGSGQSGTAGASGSGSICNPAFCPNTGSGTPCCIMGLDTCGMDIGMGCVKTD